MAENKGQEAPAVKPSLEDALNLIEVPPVREMVGEKLRHAQKLIQENNSRVLALREAKATDPNNVEHLDAVWHRVIADNVNDKEMIAAEKKYQLAIAESEKQLKILREGAKARHIKPPMSEEEQQKTRKLIQEGKATITNERLIAEQYAEMADKMLESAGKPGIEGGFISLLPNVESMLNLRGGRKAASSGDGTGSYATRLIDAQIDGKSTNKEKKKGGETKSVAHFNFLAEELSKRFGVSTFPENGVTAEELEQAYYDSKNVAFRNSGDMPDSHTFDFTKEIKVQNANDEGHKVEPHTVKLTVIRWTKETVEAANENDAPADNADEAKQEGEKAEEKANA